MKRTIQAITLAALIMLATCATPALGEGPGPPPDWPPKANVSVPVVNPMPASLIHLM